MELLPPVGAPALQGGISSGALMSSHCAQFSGITRWFALGSCFCHALPGKTVYPLPVHGGLSSKLLFPSWGGKSPACALGTLALAPFLTTHPLFPCLAVGSRKGKDAQGLMPSCFSRAQGNGEGNARPCSPEPLACHVEVARSMYII